ncbi:MAG: LysE family translocator [Pseudomonadota bacterium]
MIDGSVWFAFAIASALLLAVPGPTVLTVVAYALRHGARSRLPLVGAVVLGDTTAVALSVLGLGSILAISAAAFTAVKWAGGLLLIAIGVRWLLAAARGEAAPSAAESGDERILTNTYLVTALNPKGIVFFAAFLPQFVDANLPVLPQLLILGATFVALAGINTALYAGFAASLAQRFGNPAAHRRLRFTGGSALIAAGVYTLLAERGK